MEPIVRERTRVRTAAGDLEALIHYFPSEVPQPGLVLVDGSGEGTADGWGGAVDLLVLCGAVVLTHDKPGCGDSPGDWRTQSLTARAEESLAAAALLSSHPAVAGTECGLYGVSQGGWVALIAAALDTRIRFVISNSGPGVSPAFQDRFRILNDLRQDGQDDTALTEAGQWLDERADLLLSGQVLEEVLTLQEGFTERTWYKIATRHFDNVEMLGFLRRVLDFEPALILPKVQCPVLALLGASDPMVPVPESVTAFSSLLPSLPGNPHGIAVFPGAGHGLFTEAPDLDIDRASQLAAGFIPMVQAFIHKIRPSRATTASTDPYAAGAVSRVRANHLREVLHLEMRDSEDVTSRRGKSVSYAGRERAADQPKPSGDGMDHKTRILIAGAFIAGLSALTQLLFVMTKLPVIFWSDLLGGVFAAVVTAFLLVLLRGRLRRSA